MSMRSRGVRDMKACIPCAKLKTKCEYANRGDKCKRCLRLGKECSSQAPGTYSGKRQQQSWSNRDDILRLESKVDSVSQLLSAAAPPIHIALTSSAQPSPLSGVNGEDYLPNDHEAVYLLGVFRTQMAPLFPFIVIPPYTTPHEIKVNSPLLYLAIMMAACQTNVNRQLELARKIQQEIGRAILVHGERNLGLLQGLLVYVAWNHAHLQLGHHLIALLHLTMSLITELGLDKDPNNCSRIEAGAFRWVDTERPKPDPRTLDERRAFLGLLWMSSITKVCFKDIYPLRFTKYAEDCCQILEESNERAGDVYLVQLIRIQKKVQRVGDSIYADDCITEINASLALSISSLEEEVQKVEPAPLPKTSQGLLIRMSHKMLQLYLYKIALDDRTFPPLSAYSTLRTNLLFSCLSSIEALLFAFFDLPATTVLPLPYPYWGLVGHSMLVLSRLAEIKHGSWNGMVVSRVLDTRDACRRLASKLEAVVATGIEEVPARRLPDMFGQLIAKLKSMGGVVRSEETGFLSGEMLGGEDFLSDGLFDFLEWA